MEPVDFNGVLLGTSTVDEVLRAWGEPKQRVDQDGVLRMNFVLPPFAAVEVMFLGDVASSIIVDLGEFFPAAAVAEELGLQDMPSVAIDDDRGRTLGVVYPERGVAFRFDGDGSQRLVAQIGLDKIDARPFVLRAERSLDTGYRRALDDAATALRLDPKQSRASYVRALALHRLGRPREALEAIEAALRLEEKNLEYLLVRAELLSAVGMFDAALDDDKTVIEGSAAALHLQARAWCLRGDLLAGGPTRDYAAAVDAHTRAVRLAEPLVNDERRGVRRAAREVLVDAHLAIAQDVAWGDWQRKETVVPLWLSRAEKFARESIEQGDLPADVLLRVYAGGLETSVGLQGAADPKPWAERLRTTARDLAEHCDDELRLRCIQYEAGMGLYDALQTLHTRGEIDDAVACGRMAVDLIQAGREGRDESPTDAYRYGRLYFRLGSLYAVQREDHASAVEWFDRAAPLLERPLPAAAAADRGRQGESLVSMGVSYWAVGKQERGLELTETGRRYMQAAVDDGSLEPQALSVAFANLATMHRRNGDTAESARYAEMASRSEAAAGGALRR